MRIALAAAFALSAAASAQAAVQNGSSYDFSAGPATISPTAVIGGTDTGNQITYGPTQLLQTNWTATGLSLEFGAIDIFGTGIGGRLITISGITFASGETLASVAEGSDVFDIVDNLQVLGPDSFSFDFAGISSGDTSNPAARIDITLDQSAAAVPVPAAGLLLLSGLAGVAALRRRG